MFKGKIQEFCKKNPQNLVSGTPFRATTTKNERCEELKYFFLKKEIVNGRFLLATEKLKQIFVFSPLIYESSFGDPTRLHFFLLTFSHNDFFISSVWSGGYWVGFVSS